MRRIVPLGGLLLTMLACGGDREATPEELAEATARADSLAGVIATLERDLASARAEVRAARAAAGNGDSAAAASGGEADTTQLDQSTQQAAGDQGEPEPFSGPAAEGLTEALLRFAGDRGATITYVGAVRDGKAEGLGYGVWTTGSAYEGQWKANKRHGPGRHKYPDGAVYEGTYVNDQREGQGTYHYKNGQRWEGPWKDNMRHGEGVLYEANGRVRVRGVWEKDRLVREIKN